MPPVYAGPDPGSTSESLIALAKAQDALAWERLCSVYGPLVYAWVRRTGISESDAADIGQEVFFTLCRRIESFDPHVESATFRGWLRVIVRNKVGDLLRRRQDKPLLGDLVALVEPDDPSSDLAISEKHVVLQNALRSIRVEFEPKTWEAFWATVVEDRPTGTVAEQLATTPQAVRQSRYRVLHRLRTLLRDEKLE